MAAPRRTAVAWSRILRVLACLALVAGAVSALNAGGSASAAVRSTSRLSVPVDGPVTLPETVDWSALESAGNSAISAYAAEGTADIESFLQQVSQEQQAGSQLKTEGQSFDQRENALTQQAESVKSQESALAQKGNQLDEAGQALDEKIAAHNAEKGSIDNTNAAAVDAYNQEADDLDSQRSNLDSEAQSIQDQQNQLDQEASSISSQTDQLNSDIDSYNQRVDAYNSALQQLEALAQQLVEQEAQAEQSATVNPPSPAVAMDDGGDAASPTGQATLDADQGVGDTGGDSPSAQPQIDALHEYAQQNGVRVLAQPGTATLTPGSVSELPATQAIQLGTPVGTYDGLVPEPNGHYKALEVRTPQPISQKQKTFTQTLTRGGQARATVNGRPVIIDSTQSVAPSSSPAPGSTPGSNPSPRSLRPPPLQAVHPEGIKQGPDPKCTIDGQSFVYNTKLDRDRATGGVACLTKGGYDYTTDNGELKYKNNSRITGTPVKNGFIPTCGKSGASGLTWPKDWPKCWPDGFDRGHLIANLLGGSGDTLKNLVPMYSIVNKSRMKRIELRVSNAIQNGNSTVFYTVTPEYSGGDVIPEDLILNAWKMLPRGGWVTLIPLNYKIVNKP